VQKPPKTVLQLGSARTRWRSLQSYNATPDPRSWISGECLGPGGLREKVKEEGKRERWGKGRRKDKMRERR